MDVDRPFPRQLDRWSPYRGHESVAIEEITINSIDGDDGVCCNCCRVGGGGEGVNVDDHAKVKVRNVDVVHDESASSSETTTENSPYHTCCGISRRLCCGNMYCPPRVTRRDRRCVSICLTVILGVLTGLVATAYMLAKLYHVKLHAGTMMAVYVTISIQILVIVLIAVLTFSIISWWKTLSCLHHKDDGSFEESEDNYVIVRNVSYDLERGSMGIAFFSSTKEDSDTFTAHKQDRPVSFSDVEEGSSQSESIRRQDVVHAIEHHNEAFIENVALVLSHRQNQHVVENRPW